MAVVRLRLFTESVASASAYVKPERLPPTEGATLYHSLRVHLQLVIWQGYSEITPTSWGWKVTDDAKYIPRMNDNAPAPQSLLKIVHCSCKSMYDSQRCSCKKLYLFCALACKNCHGMNCVNRVNDTDSDDMESDESDD